MLTWSWQLFQTCHLIGNRILTASIFRSGFKFFLCCVLPATQKQARLVTRCIPSCLSPSCPLASASKAYLLPCSSSMEHLPAVLLQPFPNDTLIFESPGPDLCCPLSFRICVGLRSVKWRVNRAERSWDFICCYSNASCVCVTSIFPGPEPHVLEADWTVSWQSPALWYA